MASHRSSDENGSRRGGDAVGDTFQLVEQGLQHLQEAECKIQKALQLQRQDAEQKILQAQCLQKQEVKQRNQEALCLTKHEVEQMIEEALLHQKQEMEKKIQEALHLQKQDAEQKLQKALHLQKQDAEQKIQETLHLQKQEEQKIQDALRLQKQEAEQKIEEVLRLQETAEHRMQEALRLQEQTATALRDMQLELQEKNASILTLQQRLQKTEEIVMVLQEKTTALDASGGQGLQRLEDRMEKVETSLQIATQKFMPRVEALLRQMEEPQTTRASLTTAAASSATTTRNLKATGGAAAGSGEDSQPPKVFPTFSYTSTLTSSGAVHQGEAVDEEEREKWLVNRRMEDLELRAEQARISPCPLGEALCDAVAKERISDVRRLIDSGADVNYVNSSYFTPFLEAVWKKNADIVSLLLQRGADPNVLDGYGYSALHDIAQNGDSGQLMDMLVSAGSNVNARNESGETPLHYAGHYNKITVVRALLAAGARRDLKPWDGQWKNKTPFDISVSHDVRNLLRL